MAEIPTGFVTHARKVCSLYKRALRSLENFDYPRHEYRYVAVLLRQRFENNRHVPDARIAKRLLLDGEEELFQNSHWDEYKFPNSPGGIAYERFIEPSDSVLDYWDPIEKARYPKYFARREELKKQYAKLYKKTFPETSQEINKSNN